MPTEKLLDQACEDGKHELEPVPGATFARRCQRCGLAGQTLVDDLGHSLH